MNKVILTDTGFWLGLIDPTDQFHSFAMNIADLIEGNRIIFPWPCLYETISTHLTRRRERLLLLEEILSKPNIIYLEDNEYKIEALNQVFQFNRSVDFTYSLTDCVIREIIKDIDVRVDYLVTFNERDFKDVCDQRFIEIINQ